MAVTGKIQPPNGPGVPKLTGGGKVQGKPNVANISGSSLDAQIRATQAGKMPNGKLPSK